MGTPIIIVQGDTFSRVVRWESAELTYKAITGITQAAPAVVTAPGHGLTTGWRAVVVSAKGMTEINAPERVRESSWRRVAVTDANTVQLPAVDSSSFRAYASGGYLMYYLPTDLSGYTARLIAKDKTGGTTLLTLTTENGGISIDNTAKTIRLLVSASDTAAITWRTGVYDLEMVSALGAVEKILRGTITVTPEITT